MTADADGPSKDALAGSSRPTSGRGAHGPSTVALELAATRRGHEANLLAWAIALTTAAGFLLELATEQPALWLPLLQATGLSALAAIAHTATRRLAPLADPVVLPLVVLLNGIGLVLIRRVDLAEGTRLAGLQMAWSTIAVLGFVIVLAVLRSPRQIARYHYTLGLLTVLLLLLPMLPGIGREINGARLWINLGPMSFQPGELAKLTMVGFLAGYLEQKRALLSVATTRIGPLLMPPARHLGPVLAAAGASLLVMVVQRDLGTAMLFFGTFIVLLWIATGRVTYPAVGSLAFLAGGAIAWRMFDHVRLRVSIWLDPWADIDGAGYQLAQVAFAMSTGGLTGTGLGLGRPNDLPYAATDAIFAVLGEELGLLGAIAVLVAYLLLVTRALHMSLTARDEVGTLVAAGLAATLGLQVFVVVGGLTRVVPLSGITLPWVSYGGSSLVANYVLLGVLLRVGDEARRVELLGPEAAANPSALTGARP